MAATWLRKDSTLATPPAIMIGAIIAGLLFAGSVQSLLSTKGLALAHATPLGWAFGLGCNLVGMLLVYAYWNMKRWAVVGMVALAVVNVMVAVPLVANAPNAAAGIAAIRLLPCLPAVIYWHRMTWECR